MAKEKKDWLTRIESRWSLAKSLGAVPVIGAFVSGGFAWLTDAMSYWAPFSWFAAAVLGALVFTLWGAVRSWQKERDERRRRIALLEAPKGQINPLDERFTRQRIFISDLLPPGGARLIERKEFRDCEIVGPAIILLGATGRGRGEAVDCGFFDCDGIIGRDDGVALNAILFRDCSFRRCRFYSVTLIVPESEYVRLEPELRNMNLLNRPPPVPPAGAA